MIARFCTYTTLRNLRPSDAFFVLYLMDGVHLSFLAIGGLLAVERVVTGLLEVPLGAATDRWGRRRGLILCFAAMTVAFSLFWYAAQQAEPLPWLYGAQVLFAVGEALRSGTHKAIILDWLDRQGRATEKTRVLAITRLFSKTSAGSSALLGGVLLWTTGEWASLFIVGAVVSVAGAVLMITYPRELERSAPAEPAPSKAGDASAAAKRSVNWPLIALIASSVLFEAHLRLAAQYLQPCLKEAVGLVDLKVVGAAGAIAIGTYQFVQGLLAGGAALLGSPLVRRAGGEARAQLICIGAALAISVAAAVALASTLPIVAAALLLLLGATQNARRPVFVAYLDGFMPKRWRATTLSIENQARSWWFAGITIGAGAVADAVGLAGAFAIVSAGLVVSAVLALVTAPTRRTPSAVAEHVTTNGGAAEA